MIEIIIWNSLNEFLKTLTVINLNHFQRAIIPFTQKRFNSNDDDEGKIELNPRNGKNWDGNQF